MDRIQTMSGKTEDTVEKICRVRSGPISVPDTNVFI